jgi:hypothetical protein
MLINQLGSTCVHPLSLESWLRVKDEKLWQRKEAYVNAKNYPNFLVIAMIAIEGGFGHEKLYVNNFIDFGVIL